jgi:hypothetical protein
MLNNKMISYSLHKIILYNIDDDEWIPMHITLLVREFRGICCSDELHPAHKNKTHTHEQT